MTQPNSPQHESVSQVAQQSQTNRRWRTIVWNDPINLMSYVVFVFREHFGFSTPKAHRLMLQVHDEGSAEVFVGAREEAEGHVYALHTYGLKATMEAED